MCKYQGDPMSSGGRKRGGRRSGERDVHDVRALVAGIVESSYDAIVTKDLNGIVTSWNEAAHRMFGYSAEEMIGQPIRRLIPPERQAEEDDILARLSKGQRIDHFETVRITKDGRRLDISVTISPLRNAAGKITGASKIARDISATRAAEAERVRLLEANAAITGALNDVGAIVASDLDREKVSQLVTDAATALTTAHLGAFFYRIIGDSGEAQFLHSVSGASADMFTESSIARNARVFDATFGRAAVVRKADVAKERSRGHQHPHKGIGPGQQAARSFLAVPVRGRSGDAIGGLFFWHADAGHFTDDHEQLAVGIASWASVALENARLYAIAREASRLKDDFLASLSHELRTPLNAILGYARMLRTGILPADRHERAIETIERNATSLTQIVEDVLDISRIVSGKIRLNVQPVDFPAVVRNSIDAVTPAAEARGVRIESVLDPSGQPISGDPERLQQILWNLLSNAVKFTGRGGRIQVVLSRVNSHVEVSVSDTGVGIAPEFLPHVFERFRQADSGIARERGGLGLGLSIARQLTEMHGGTIEVSSAGVGQGATFTVKMPMMIVHALRQDGDRVHPHAVLSAKAAAAAELGGIHVLAVDDDADALALVEEVLSSAGARVTMARSAEEVLKHLRREVPQVLVADLGMPRVDGFQLIDRIRHHTNPEVRRIPAAALTAYARSEDRVKALRAGFQIHLSKPIDPAELVTTIAALARGLTAGDATDGAPSSITS